MPRKPKKRKIRARHTGRLELRGQTFIARWMEVGIRHSESTGIRLADFDGNAEKAREAADRWLARRLGYLRARDSILKNEKDEEAVRAQLEGVYRGELAAIEERRKAEQSDSIPPVAIAEAYDRLLYSPEYRKPKEHTLVLVKGRIDKLSRWLAEHHPSVKFLREITPMLAKEYAGLIKNELGNTTFKTHICTLSQIWRVLADEIKGDGINPWEKIPTQKAEASCRRALTDAELAAVFDGAKGNRDLTLLFGFMLFAGMRLSDACLVKWENVRLDRGILDFTAVKTGAKCKPPLVAELRAMLMQTPESKRTGYVLPGFAATYDKDPRPMSILVSRHFRKCGIATSITGKDGRSHPAATAHSFRHTFISKCGNAGVPLAIVQGWVGHMSKDMTEHYFHDDERATLMYARQIPASTVAPQIAAVEPLQALPCARGATIPADGTDAPQSRYGALCAILDEMTADELEKARREIDNRLGTIEV